MKNVTVVIPTWNGLEIIKKSFPVVEKESGDSPIIVIDDGSSDDTEGYLSDKKILFLKNNTNLGFTKSVNLALTKVTTEYVCLLNNDVYPQRGFIKKALDILENDKEVVAVTFNEENSSWPQVAWSNGKLEFTQGVKDGSDHYCLWPSGGSCIIKTETFKKLGGFREVFSPGYFEDIEFGVRIWVSGKKIVWINDAKVIHKHETSFKKLDPKFVSDLKQSNELVFTWLTFGYGKYLTDHVRFLLSYTAAHPGYLRIILIALKKYVSMKDKMTNRTDDMDSILHLANKRYEKS